MALAYKVESLEGVDDAVKGLYVEKDGAYSLDVDLTGSNLEDVTGLKSAHEAVKSERNKYRDNYNQLRPYEALKDIEGFDPSNINDLMAKAASAGDPDAIEKIQRQAEKEIEKVRAENAGLQDQINAATKEKDVFIRGRELIEAAGLSGVAKDYLTDAVALTQNEFKVVNGKTIHVDADGDPTGLTPTEFYATINKEKRPRLYDAVDMSGGGSRKSAGGAGKTNKKRSDMRAAEKSAYITEHGQEAFLALPK